MFLGNVVALANERGGRLVLGMADARPHKVVGSDFAVNETGISSDFKISLTASRTQQLCDAMTVSKDMMANLLLALVVEAVSVRVAEVPQVSSPTGTVLRRIQAGEESKSMNYSKNMREEHQQD